MLRPPPLHPNSGRLIPDRLKPHRLRLVGSRCPVHPGRQRNPAARMVVIVIPPCHYRDWRTRLLRIEHRYRWNRLPDCCPQTPASRIHRPLGLLDRWGKPATGGLPDPILGGVHHAVCRLLGQDRPRLTATRPAFQQNRGCPICLHRSDRLPTAKLCCFGIVPFATAGAGLGGAATKTGRLSEGCCWCRCRRRHPVGRAASERPSGFATTPRIALIRFDTPSLPAETFARPARTCRYQGPERHLPPTPAAASAAPPEVLAAPAQPRRRR